MKILAIDPGSKYNGIAAHDTDKDTYQTMELNDYVLVWKLVMNGKWDVVICEDFTAQFISAYGITAVRVVGGIEALCQFKRATVFYRPRPQDRLRYIYAADQILLKVHGKKPPRDHQQSAMAHLLWYKEVMLGEKVR